MRKTVAHLISFCLWWVWLLSYPAHAQGDDVFDRKIQIRKGSGTIYRMLGQVSEQSGFLFIYDSKLIDDELKIKIKTGEFSIREAITRIVRNPSIDMRVVGKHILLYQPDKDKQAIINLTVGTTPLPEAKKDTFFSVEGILRDRYTEEPLPFASIGIVGKSIGTISNQSGEFRIRLPDSLRHDKLYFAFLGYQPLEIENELLANGYHHIAMEPQVIPIQEVVIRIVNPLRLIGEMLDKRKNNYAKAPVYHTAFYREGIEYKKRFVSLTESVMKIYKSPLNAMNDQSKLLKMRNITNQMEKDTLVAKFKAGVDACLLLDLIKNEPDFLQLGNKNLYDYIHSDIIVVDNRLANVISFEQNKNTDLPLYKGELYIDTENSALVGARFEINPKYVGTTTDMYITKKSKSVTITPQKIEYSVSYKQWNGTYYINHIRGDLHFNVRKKGRLFFNAPVHIWFEMVNCATDTTNVERFARNETLRTRTVFAETQYIFDNTFWENFNIIQPEESLSEAINKITAKIEEKGY